MEFEMGHPLEDKSLKGKSDNNHRRANLGFLGFLSSLVALYIALRGFPLHWFMSGAPELTALLLLGRRLPAIVPVSMNLAYAVYSTSWLLSYGFGAFCWPTVFLVAVYELDIVSTIVRKSLRTVLRELHFTADKIAFFNLPALEIDTEVDGLLNIRGVTISLSSLTVIAHGIEVGIKLSDDMELAIQTEKCTIRLFRDIQVDPCYANLKGGEYEMTFGQLADSTDDADGNALMNSDTPLLKAAAAASDVALDEKTMMKNRMTNTLNGAAPQSSSAEAGYRSMTKMSADDEQAFNRYDQSIKQIEESSNIRVCAEKIRKRVRSVSSDGTAGFDYRNENDMNAAICSELHDTPSVPHPPRRSVKVTTLQHLSGPRQKQFMHRLPLLLRLMLNVLGHLHTIHIASITAAGSGRWVQEMLQEHVWKHYLQGDAETSKLEQRVSGWLSDANFAVELKNISALAQVPIVSAYNVLAQIKFDDVMVYRTLPKEIKLKQVMRLAGADAQFSIPSYLIPHHEHLLPPIPTEADRRRMKRGVDAAEGIPNEVNAQNALEQTQKDETNVKISARIKLPTVFDQEVLDWTAAMVKLSKMVEMEREPSALYDVKIGHGFKELGKALNSTMRDSVKRVTVDAIANDRWIAKLVGKVVRKLESARGDVGYSGDIPVSLKPYRDLAEKATKLLP